MKTTRNYNTRITLRLENETYQKIGELAKKYKVSINQEINVLLECVVKRWEKKTITIHSIPQHLEEIQNENIDEIFNSFDTEKEKSTSNK